MGKKLTYNYVKQYIEDSGCLLLENTYKSCDEKMLMKCSCGNIFYQTFYRFKNRGFIRCKTCTYDLLSQRSSLDKDVIKKRVEEVGYKLLEIERPGKDQIITIQCNEGHIYTTRLNKFTAGRRCPHCKQSQGEYRIYTWLKNNNINFIREYTFDDLVGLGNCKLRFDFCIIDNNKIKLLIEYDGKQHYEETPFMTDNERIRYHDKLKDMYCKNHNYELLRIDYKQFTHIEEILNQQNIV